MPYNTPKQDKRKLEKQHKAWQTIESGIKGIPEEDLNDLRYKHRNNHNKSYKE